jgi:hypothetical protein
MAEVTGGLAHLKFLHFRLMLVAVGAVNLLALDLLFLIQVRFMDEAHLLCEFDLLGLELVIRFSVAICGHAAGVHDPGPRLDRFTAQGQIREALGWLFGDMFGLSRYTGLLSGLDFKFPGWIMTLHAAIFVVFLFFPKFVPLIDHTWVCQDMTIPTKHLGLRGLQLGEFGLYLRHRFGPKCREGQSQDHHCAQNQCMMDHFLIPHDQSLSPSLLVAPSCQKLLTQ